MTARYPRPPVVLTFIAPADQCNQRCPACILDRVGEPVRQFELTPVDYARFTDQFVRAGIPILSIAFQGYEVTLPRSWPYVEPVFATANRLGVRKSFVTNGMLLHKWTDRVVALAPERISVSLDGAHAEANDRIRGLHGAFDATTSSVRRFLEDAPSYRDRLSIASILYDEANFRSLLDMPKVLASLGVSRWTLGFELEVVDGRERPAHPKRVLVEWLEALSVSAKEEGIDAYVNDEMGFFKSLESHDTVLEAKRLFDPRFLYRVEPTGHVRVGLEVTEAWDEMTTRIWSPNRNDAVEVVGYWTSVEELRSAQRRSRHSGHFGQYELPGHPDASRGGPA